MRDSKHTNPLKGKLYSEKPREETRLSTVPFSSSVSSHQILLRFSCAHVSVPEGTCSSDNSILPYYRDMAFIWEFSQKWTSFGPGAPRQFFLRLATNAAVRQVADEVTRETLPLCDFKGSRRQWKIVFGV